jgi:hypothetical protein
MELKMLVAIYQELGHAVVARRQGYALSSFQIENAGNGIFHGQSGIAYAADTPYQLALAAAFAGPLAEIRCAGGKRQIDFARSFVPLAVANQKLSTRIYFVGEKAPVPIQRDTFSDDWNFVNDTITKAIQEGDQVNHLELYLQTLQATIGIINDDAQWTVIDSVAQQVAQYPPIATLLAGQQAEIHEFVNGLLAAHIPLEGEGN